MHVSQLAPFNIELCDLIIVITLHYCDKIPLSNTLVYKNKPANMYNIHTLLLFIKIIIVTEIIYDVLSRNRFFHYRTALHRNHLLGNKHVAV